VAISVRVHQLRRLIAGQIRHDGDGIRFAGGRTAGAAVRDETADNRGNKTHRTSERRTYGVDLPYSRGLEAYMLLRSGNGRDVQRDNLYSLALVLPC